MKHLLLLISVFVLFDFSESSAQSPPFTLITISGQTSTEYNRVSLFANGSATEPLKTEYISEFDGQYSIDVNIPDDMRKKGSYYFTDMRFWRDMNENGVKEGDERRSACHFIIWVPKEEQIFLQKYKGAKQPINSSVFYYDHK